MQGFQSADSIHMINSLTPGLFSVNTMCTEQNVNNQSLTQVSQFYFHVVFCLKVIGS